MENKITGKTTEKGTEKKRKQIPATGTEEIKVWGIENGEFKLLPFQDSFVTRENIIDIWKPVEIEITPEFLQKRPLSYSSLKDFRKSPAHYIEHFREQVKEEATYFALGKAVECLVFEPEKFDEKFKIFTKFPLRKDSDKERWQNMLEDAKKNNYVLLDSEVYPQAVCMAESVKRTPETAYYLDKIKQTQVKIEWIDKKTGLPIIGYLDVLCDVDGNLIIIDFKTAISADPDDFFKAAANFEYEIQVGSYLTGYHKKHYLFPDFMFMVVESKPPYNATMIHCPADFINYAKLEFEHTLTAFKYCMDNKLFHKGYHFWDAGLGYFNMEKPRWKKSKLLQD